ncbi:unnamed protein product [Chrysodeixis includens]|uniref:Uncharacterized protein n=1 Tax=Chrysodeixis includens TaxID=689277 RepID=A0A9N8Q074_CHRIL|nr:unnamed protein product [Chrysodeixis includens]
MKPKLTYEFLLTIVQSLRNNILKHRNLLNRRYIAVNLNQQGTQYVIRIYSNNTVPRNQFKFHQSRPCYHATFHIDKLCVSNAPVCPQQNLQVYGRHDVPRLGLADPRVCGGHAVHVLLEPPQGARELEDSVRGRGAAAGGRRPARHGRLRRGRARERPPGRRVLRGRHDLLRARRLPRRLHLARRQRTERLRLLSPPIVHLIHCTL